MLKPLTKSSTFESLSDEEKYTLLHERELEVKRLQRIAQDLAVWKEGTPYYEESLKELNEYLEGE